MQNLEVLRVGLSTHTVGSVLPPQEAYHPHLHQHPLQIDDH